VSDLCLGRRGLTGEVAGVTGRRVFGVAAGGTTGGRRLGRGFGGTLGRGGRTGLEGVRRDAALVHGS